MIIRKGKISDLNNIMKMYNSCVSGMIKNGIDQWDDTYPDNKTIFEDLENQIEAKEKESLEMYHRLEEEE